MEGRKRTGLAWEDSGEIYSDKLKQLRTLRALKTSTLSVVSAITLSIRFGCLPLTDRAPESSLRLSPRVPTPRWLYWVSPRQLLQSDTGVPHFALDPLTYRCLLSLSPAADFAEPRPPRHRVQHGQCDDSSFPSGRCLRWCWNSNLDVHWYNNVWVRRWVVIFYYFHQNNAKSRSLWMCCFLFSLCIYSTSEWVGWVMCKEGAGGGALLSLH